VSVILNNLQDTAHQYHRIGYSKKGWTNGEIGVEWIQEFGVMFGPFVRTSM